MYAVPWTMPDHSIPDRPSASTDAPQKANAGSQPQHLVMAMSEAGVSPLLKVLYVADYMPSAKRISATGALWIELCRLLPGWRIEIAIVEGPFEDDEGEAHAHFEGTKHGLTPAKQVLEIKRELLTAMVKVLRACAVHRPQVLLGDGQGALVCLAVSKPLQVEVALAARNVQREEAKSIADAWGGILAIGCRQPRLGKAKVGAELFKLAAPECFLEGYPISPRKVIAVLDKSKPGHDEEARLYDGLDIVPVSKLDDLAWDSIVSAHKLLMWEHNGVCQCGKRTFLFALCSKCLKDDAANRCDAAIDQANADGVADTNEKEQPDVLVAELAAIKLLRNVGLAPVCLGKTTSRVVFVSDLDIITSVGAPWLDVPKREWKRTAGGLPVNAQVTIWKKGHSLTIPCTPAADSVAFRAAFVVHRDMNVVPLQQCVAWKFEESHEIMPSVWDRCGETLKSRSSSTKDS